MSLCNTIDTLAMAYLDDELAAEERHELEAHLTECASCRGTLERERADRSMLRRALAAPPAPDMLRARLARVLDEQDRVETREQRRRWTSFVLPGSAIMAAAAAIAVFVAVQAPSSTQKVASAVQPATSTQKVTASVSHEVLKQTKRALPLEVQGPSTGPWLRQHLARDVALPQFQESGAEVIGGRLLPGGIRGHDATMTSYRVQLADRPPFVLSMLQVYDLEGDEMRDGTPVRINNRTLYVFESERGDVVVSYVAPNRVGFMFVAPDLSSDELIRLVGNANLLGPQ